MRSRKDRISLEAFLKRTWPALLFGALLCVGVSLFIFQAVVQGHFRKATDTIQDFVQEVVADEWTRGIDGQPVESEEEAYPTLYSVMIDNAPDAWPHVGVADAVLVMEAPVEGGITRLFAVFDGTEDLSAIGPVRSARPYFVDWAEALQSVYTHVGGSPAALEQIQATDEFRDLNEFAHPLRFSRSAKRFAPHNAFTSTEDLTVFSSIREWATSAFASWVFSEPKGDAGDVSDIRVPYGGPWTVDWSYDTEDDSYTRVQGGIPHRDVDGAEVRVQNVVVLRTSAIVVDEVGRLNLRTEGFGEAVLFTHGERFDGTWSREAGEWIQFNDENEEPLLFAPGKTWISVVTDERMFPKQEQE